MQIKLAVITYLIFVNPTRTTLNLSFSAKEITNEIILLALPAKEKGHQIAFLGDCSRRIFSKKTKNVNDCLEIQCKYRNVDFISHKNVNPRSHLNQDRLEQNRKGQHMMRNNFSTFINNFYV